MTVRPTFCEPESHAQLLATESIAQEGLSREVQKFGIPGARLASSEPKGSCLLCVIWPRGLKLDLCHGWEVQTIPLPIVMDGFPELLGPARLAIKYRVDTVRPSKTSAGRRRRWECMDSADASTNWLSPQKFSAVQDILDQNKCVLNHSRWPW